MMNEGTANEAKGKTMKTKAYIAINGYRSSTDDGFGNTWTVYECASAKMRNKILREGLPVRDQVILHDDGTRSPYCTKNGIRLATRQEIREASASGNPLPKFEECYYAYSRSDEELKALHAELEQASHGQGG